MTAVTRQPNTKIDPDDFIAVFDRYEHALERERPHRSFQAVTAESLKRTMVEVGLRHQPADCDLLTSSMSKMPPFPEVVTTLGDLKQAGFKLCIVSNTDGGIIVGNVAQPGGQIDRVVTAEQAQAYKFRQLETALEVIDQFPDDVVHKQAAPGNAAMELRRDQARLFSHDRELFLEALQKVIDILGDDEKRAHQHDWPNVVLKLLREADAIVQIDDVRRVACRALASGGERWPQVQQRSKHGSGRSGLKQVTTSDSQNVAEPELRSR